MQVLAQCVVRSARCTPCGSCEVLVKRPVTDSGVYAGSGFIDAVRLGSRECCKFLSKAVGETSAGQQLRKWHKDEEWQGCMGASSQCLLAVSARAPGAEAYNIPTMHTCSE